MISNSTLDYGFGTYNQFNNKEYKSLLVIAVDFSFRIFFPEIGIEVMDYRAENGEDILSKQGIEAGRKYIQNKK